MLRRLRSMIAWNGYHQVHNEQFANYYGSLSSRNHVRREARKRVDDAIDRAAFWL